MFTSSKIISFLFNLSFPVDLPANVQVMNPFSDPETRQACTLFYNKFYNDNHKRYTIVGINPGRFGGGITGIPFTDPVRLKNKLNIDNPWPLKQELSSVFIYDMIDAFGGPEKFYRQLYFTSVSPLGFTRQGKNLNYYDDKELVKSIQPFAFDCLTKQMEWCHSKVAFCLGEGANYKFVTRFNEEFGFFEKIIPLPHPRFVMQYKLKTKQNYIAKYLEAFSSLG